MLHNCFLCIIDSALPLFSLAGTYRIDSRRLGAEMPRIWTCLFNESGGRMAVEASLMIAATKYVPGQWGSFLYSYAHEEARREPGNSNAQDVRSRHLP